LEACIYICNAVDAKWTMNKKILTRDSWVGCGRKDCCEDAEQVILSRSCWMPSEMTWKMHLRHDSRCATWREISHHNARARSPLWVPSNITRNASWRGKPWEQLGGNGHLKLQIFKDIILQLSSGSGKIR
jgi:hypothetical protein